MHWVSLMVDTSTFTRGILTKKKGVRSGDGFSFRSLFRNLKFLCRNSDIPNPCRSIFFLLSLEEVYLLCWLLLFSTTGFFSSVFPSFYFDAIFPNNANNLFTYGITHGKRPPFWSLLCNLLSNSHRLTQTLLPSGYSVNKFNQIPGISYLIFSLQPCNLSLKSEIKEPWKMLKCITNKANKEEEKVGDDSRKILNFPCNCKNNNKSWERGPWREWFHWNGE